MNDSGTTPSDDPATTAAERDERVAHGSDREPSPDEDRAAPTEADPDVAQAYRDAIERGARVRGEGQISPDPLS